MDAGGDRLPLPQPREESEPLSESEPPLNKAGARGLEGAGRAPLGRCFGEGRPATAHWLQRTPPRSEKGRLPRRARARVQAAARGTARPILAAPAGALLPCTSRQRAGACPALEAEFLRCTESPVAAGACRV